MLGVFGASFGSFAGATAWRLHKKRDFIKDRSECEHCHHKLSALELIPIVSWVFLRGRCRHCKHPIGYVSILIEVFTAAAYVVSYVYWPFGFETLLSTILFGIWLVMLVMMAILFVYDLRWKLLPNVVLFPLLLLGVVSFVLRHSLLETPLAQWPLELMMALLPVAGLYGILYMVSNHRWVGMGDVKLGIFMGLVLSWEQAIVALILANLLGSLIVIGPLLQGKLKKDAHVPFGPLLIVATVVALLWGGLIIGSYLWSMGI